MSDLIIRRYLTSDKEKVKDLYILASHHSEIGYRSGPWEQDFENIEGAYFDGGEFLVGVLDQEIIAMVGLRKISDSMGHIRRMRVHPKYRKKGFGQLILKELEQRAINNRLTELRLRTSTQQKMAQSFYEKNGYQKMDSNKEFYTEGPFEVIWYHKKLG
jgi:ribosomal protein S18 acetylase RimI-like enzyme